MLNDYGQAPAPQGGFSPELRFAAALSQRRQLRALGFWIGSAILLFILLQNLLTLPLLFPSVRTQYNNDPLLHDGVDLLIMLCSMLLPFLLCSRPMRRISGCAEPLPLDAPRMGADVLLTIPAGLMLCTVANYVTDLLVRALSGVGVTLSTPELPMPGGAFGVTVSVFRVVLMPAIVEELCFRGVVMQNLRRYGDRFAVVVAALCFGLMHCNLVQAPFAFIVGLALGYFTLQTGSLWPAIIIHALNNGVSLVYSYLSEALTDGQLGTVYLLVEGTLFGCGAICLLAYLLRRGANARLAVTPHVNTFGQKTGAVFSAPTMIIAVIAMLLFTSHYISL